jgi:hypothetical protein
VQEENTCSNVKTTEAFWAKDMQQARPDKKAHTSPFQTLQKFHNSSGSKQFPTAIAKNHLL